MRFRRFLGWALGLFVVLFIIIYFVNYRSFTSELTSEEVSSQDRYSGKDVEPIDYVYKIHSHILENGNPERLVESICIANKINSCDVDILLDKNRYESADIGDNSLGYFNIYAFGLLSDKYYVAGDLDKSIKAMVASIYHSEKLTGIDSEFYKISLVKFANILDLKNKKDNK